jgi:hypothetical protein
MLPASQLARGLVAVKRRNHEKGKSRREAVGVSVTERSF